MKITKQIESFNLDHDIVIAVENKKEVDSTTNQLSNPNQSVSLIFVGDIMLSRSVQKQIERNGNDYSYSYS